MSSFKSRIKRPLLRTLAALGRRIGSCFDRPNDGQAPRRVLVIQLGGLGDVLRVFPLLERIQTRYPQAVVTLFTNQDAGVLAFYPGTRRPEHVRFDLGWSYWRKLSELRRLRCEPPDLVVSPTRGDGMLECAVIAWLTGARHRIGFERDGAGFLYTRKQPFLESVSILEQNLGLLGTPGPEARLRLRVPETARAFAADWYEKHLPAEARCVVVHPWASSHGEFRAWPLARYAELIRGVVAAGQARVVVLGGAEEARRDRGWLGALPEGRVYDLAGTVRVDEAAAIIVGCDLFVGNDSGLLHFALAADVPAVVVFGASPPVQVLHSSRKAMAVISGTPCQPCYRHQPFFAYRCDYAFRCLSEVPVAMVLDRVLKALSALPRGAARPG